MKLKIHYLSIIVVAIATLYACVKDDPFGIRAEEAARTAMLDADPIAKGFSEWFIDAYPDIAREVDWEDFQSASTEKARYAQFTIDDPSGEYGVSGEALKGRYRRKYFTTSVKLLIACDSTMKEPRALISAVIPSAAYLEVQNFDISGHSHLSRHKLTGNILLFDMEGRLLSNKAYLEGQPTDTLQVKVLRPRPGALYKKPVTRAFGDEGGSGTDDDPYNLGGLDEVEVCGDCDEDWPGIFDPTPWWPEEDDDDIQENDDQDNGGGGSSSSSGGGTLTPPTPPEPPKPEKPCRDDEKGKANPLMDMQLAPPIPKNISGATFGYHRNDGATYHSGIDLGGSVGTPIHAMFDGVVGGPVITEQPDRIDNHYTGDYSGDKNDAGNRIYIISSVNGETIRIGYWHLQSGGNAIEINPRTGEPFKAGDQVYAGEMIGHIGITGNANAGVPHLHLVTEEGGKRVDPEKFLNGDIKDNSTDISTPCD